MRWIVRRAQMCRSCATRAPQTSIDTVQQAMRSDTPGQISVGTMLALYIRKVSSCVRRLPLCLTG